MVLHQLTAFKNIIQIGSQYQVLKTCQIYFESNHNFTYCRIIKMSQQLKIQGRLKNNQKDKNCLQKMGENYQKMVNWQKIDYEQKLLNQELIGQNKEKQKSQPLQNLKHMGQVENIQPTKKLKQGEAQFIASSTQLKCIKEAIIKEIREELMAINQQDKQFIMQSQQRVAEKLEQALKEHIQQKINEHQDQNTTQIVRLRNLIVDVIGDFERVGNSLQKLQKKVDMIDSEGL